MDLTTWVSTAIICVNHVRATLFDDGSNDPDRSNDSMDLSTWILFLTNSRVYDGLHPSDSDQGWAWGTGGKD